MAESCPLCCSSNTHAVESLPFGVLRRFYLRQMNIDLGEQSFVAIDLRRCEPCDLRFYTPAFTGDEKFYESLQRFDWYYLAEKQEYEFAAHYVSSEDRVLEVGPGRGVFAEKIKSRSYTGLELSEAAANQARERGMSVYKCSIEEHSKDNAEGYDVVCSFQVLEHIADTRSFIESCLRCLKSGGTMIHSVPYEDGFIGRQHNNILNMPPHHATRWTDQALHNLARMFDLQVIAFGYDRLSDLHLRAYSVALIENSMNRALGRRQRSLDAAFENLLVKAPVRLLSRLLERGLKDKGLRPAGHSVTIVYRKP
jgi:2-polyprenyl-3-methyl-5-hydroxy-6-metoxy-1,4-benzoquinol methylase